MNSREFLDHIEAISRDLALPATKASDKLLNVELRPNQLIPVLTRIIQTQECYLIAITGLDPGTDTGELWVLYHLGQGASIVNLRVVTEAANPIVPTVTGVIPAARIFEQELGEVLGVKIVDPQSLEPVYSDHLFLPDDWPVGVFPLRKDFSAETLTK